MKTVYIDTWTESERGWGVRPDGCSIHLNKDDYKSYVDEYWERMPKTAPDEYSRPDDSLIPMNISDELYGELVNTKNGLRLYQNSFREHNKNGVIVKLSDND